MGMKVRLGRIKSPVLVELTAEGDIQIVGLEPDVARYCEKFLANQGGFNSQR